jgi:integrase/recombinase XerC
MDKKNFFQIFPKDRIIKDKEKWFVYFRMPDSDNPGKTIRKKLTGIINDFKTVDERIIYANKLVADYLSNNPYGENIVPINTPIRQHLQRVCNVSVKENSIATRLKYQSILNEFINWANVNQLQKFSYVDAKNYIASLYDLNRAQSTINLRISFMKRLFKELIKEKIIKSNPFDEIKRKKANSEASQYFTPTQVEKLISNIQMGDPQLYLAIRLVYYCAIRLKEARAIRIKNVMMEEQRIYLPQKDTKNDKGNYVHIPLEFYLQLQDEFGNFSQFQSDEYLLGKYKGPGTLPLAKNSLTNRHRIYLKQIGLLNDYDLYYSWKHTSANRLANSNVPMIEIQHHFRHSSIEMSAIYMSRYAVNKNSDIVASFPTLNNQKSKTINRLQIAFKA